MLLCLAVLMVLEALPDAVALAGRLRGRRLPGEQHKEGDPQGLGERVAAEAGNILMLVMDYGTVRRYRAIRVMRILCPDPSHVSPLADPSQLPAPH